jgi:hypothetical protein
MTSAEAHELLNAVQAGLQVGMQSITSALVVTGDFTPIVRHTPTPLEAFSYPEAAQEWLSDQMARIPTRNAYEWNHEYQGAQTDVAFTCMKCHLSKKMFGRRLQPHQGTMQYFCADCSKEERAKQ